MSRIFADNAHSIGNTPLVQINRIAPRGVTILAKIEGATPVIRSNAASART
jgi:cysteine synthase A